MVPIPLPVYRLAAPHKLAERFMKLSINQSIDQSINQSIDQSVIYKHLMNYRRVARIFCGGGGGAYLNNRNQIINVLNDTLC